MYTPSEVFRTAFKYIDGTDTSGGFGQGLPHGINQVCACCKAGSTADGQTVGNVDRIIDPVELRPWSDFYKTRDYAAYKCDCCGYMWSWYK